MGRLILTFLDGRNQSDEHFSDPIEAILHRHGREITEYSKGYFNHVVSVTSDRDFFHGTEGRVTDCSLYLIVPEMGYDYKIMTLRYDFNRTFVDVIFFPLNSTNNESSRFPVREGWIHHVYEYSADILSSALANQTLKFLVDQVDMKRERNI